MKNILIAKIIAPFGIKGALKLLVFSDDIKIFSKYQLYDNKQQPVKLTYNLASAKQTSSGIMIIAFIEGINNRNLIEQIIGSEFFINKNNLATPKKNEFYIESLINLKVFDDQNQQIGIIKQVHNHKAGPAIVIDFIEKNLQQKYANFYDFTFNSHFFSDPDFNNNSIIFYPPEII
jgi:16S rRNA processing protein RimM